MSSPAAEYELLRLTARFCLGDQPAPVPRLNVEWNQALWLGRREGALLFLREALRQDALPVGCPDEIRAQLADLGAAAKLQALDRVAPICRLHDALIRTGIPFFVADDWMFQACFHPNQTLTETNSAIRCLVRPADLQRASTAVSAAGLPPATGDVQVAVRNQAPVMFLTKLATTGNTAGEFPPATEDGGVLTIGGRLLRRLHERDWLTLLAAPWVNRPGIPLLPAWQISLLAERTPVVLSGPRPAWLDQTIAVSRARLAPADGEGLRLRDLAPTPTAGSPPPCPFLPTPAPVVARMLALAEVGAEDTVFDLGCGDGSIVIEAVRRCGARAVGIDCDPSLLATAATHAAKAGVADRVTFRCGDLFSADLSSATVICLYLAPAFYAALHERVLRTARPGARIVSHDYFFPAWPPAKTALVRFGPAQVSQIFLWQLA